MEKPVLRSVGCPGISEMIWPGKPKEHFFRTGARIFAWDYDSSSGSTMVWSGRFEGEVTAQDILDFFGDGTFGHRGPFLGNGTFQFTKITD